jgi:hypothetical protein
VPAGSGITAPGCLGVHVGDTDAAVLLEWADGRPGEFWPIAGYRPAAEALGRAQAPFLLGRELPPVPWLSLGFLRAYSSEKPGLPGAAVPVRGRRPDGGRGHHPPRTMHGIPAAAILCPVGWVARPGGRGGRT